MSTTDVVNATLLTLGGAFAAEAVRLLATNFWLAIVSAVVGTVIFAVREVLP